MNPCGAAIGGPSMSDRNVEVMEQSRDYHVLVDARGEAGRRPSVEVILRPDPSTSLLRGEMLIAQEATADAAWHAPTRAGLVKCLETDFNAAAAAAPAPAIECSRPIGRTGPGNSKDVSLIDRTIDMQRCASRVRSELSLDFGHGITTHYQHRRGWQDQGTFDSEDNSFLFNTPRGVTKLAPFLQAQPRSSTPLNLSDSTGMSCGVLSTAFKSSPICASAKAIAQNKYASAADPHAKSVSGASQERTASLSDSQMTPELRLVGIAGLHF